MAAILLFLPFPAGAQGDETPSVSVAPADANPDGPNSGQWFFIELAPGEEGRVRASITNPADVAQRVRLYVRDLLFADDGTPVVNDEEQGDVGLWSRALSPQVQIPPNSTVVESFVITPPADAEPGDHVGVIVAESEPQGTSLKIVKRVATRLYVTLPGEAHRAFEVVSIEPEKDSWLWPRQLLVTVSLRNTGRVRLRPEVRVAGSRAAGSEVLLSRSVEQYFADVEVPFYGGPVKLPVDVQTGSGPARRVNRTLFVIPWGLLALLALAGALAFGGKRLWDRRLSRLSRIQSDLERIERLVAQRPTGPQPGEVIEVETDDEAFAIYAGLKQARRTGSHRAFSRLALTLHEMRGGALDELLEALENSSEDDRSPLVSATATYPPKVRSSSKRWANLAEEVISAIEQESRARSGGSGKKKSSKKAPKKTSKRPASKPKRAKAKSSPSRHRSK